MPALVRRPLLLILSVAMVASALLAASAGGPSNAAPSGAGVRLDHIPAPNQTVHYPTNAGTVYRWGVPKWTDEFEVGGLRNDWVQSKEGQVKTQSGMLTVIATGKNDKVTASPNSVKARYGRWEARVRIRETNHNGRRYRAYWELIPTKEYECGAKNIVLASYRSQDRRVTGAVRVPEKTQYGFSKRLALHQGWFHTYAIEITKDHISWFVDTKVIRTERRSTARTGATYDPVFRLVGKPGANMIQGRMQMDWVRYYTLDRPNAQPITAPELTESTYADAC